MSKFYLDKKNTVTREYMFTCKLQFDLMEAAARRSYPLKVYLPTVDRDGFDIIFDDGISIIPIQLKATFDKKANNWNIHRNLYRPEKEQLPGFRLHSPSYHEGMGGGVIIIDVSVDEKNNTYVTYKYSDFLILHMLKEGLFKTHNKDRYKLEKLYFSIIDQLDGKFKLPRYAFVEARTNDHLLALMGLSSTCNSMWRYEYLDYLKDKNDYNYESSWSKDPEGYLEHIRKRLLDF
ncbi:hypothetical protein [Nitrosomonas sp. Nm51]|uniref:hypothetical protein n=1 Tax=Nitrosomonas sp. Nm51 TaxID=133720 RepID=UPI00115F97C2|nr:hypothetical protein [Nitrosomonas sp. Nm51]